MIQQREWKWLASYTLNQASQATQTTRVRTDTPCMRGNELQGQAQNKNLSFRIIVVIQITLTSICYTYLSSSREKLGTLEKQIWKITMFTDGQYPVKTNFHQCRNLGFIPWEQTTRLPTEQRREKLFISCPSCVAAWGRNTIDM